MGEKEKATSSDSGGGGGVKDSQTAKWNQDHTSMNCKSEARETVSSLPYQLSSQKKKRF